MRDRNFFLICISSFIILLFLNNHSISLWDQDESAYAGFAQTMIKTNDFLVPQFDWCQPHRKPPFHFWTIALSYKFFGESDFTTRAPSVLAILGVLALIFFFTKRLFNFKVATWSSIVFMTSLLIPVYAKIAFTDASLLFFQTLCFFSIVLFFQTNDKKWLISLWLAIIGGTLTKGPPVLISSIGCIGLYFLLKRNWTSFLISFFTIVLGLFPIFIWGYLSWQRDDGNFIKWLIDWYILKRAEGSVYNQTGPLGYYSVIFLINFFCWWVFVPSMVVKVKNFFLEKKYLNKDKSILILSLLWLISSWIIYEILPSKLPSYSFGALPVLCIFFGKVIVDFFEEKIKIKNWVLYLQITILILSPIVFYFIRSQISFQNLLASIQYFSFGFMILGILALILKKYFKEKFLVILFVFLAFYIQFYAWGFFIPSFDYERNLPKRIAQSLINENKKNKHVVFSYDYSMPSILVYLQRAGYTFETVSKDIDREEMIKAMNKKDNHLFVIEGKNLADLNQVKYPISVKLHEGWVSDRGVVDSFYTVVKNSNTR